MIAFESNRTMKTKQQCNPENSRREFEELKGNFRERNQEIQVEEVLERELPRQETKAKFNLG